MFDEWIFTYISALSYLQYVRASHMGDKPTVGVCYTWKHRWMCNFSVAGVSRILDSDLWIEVSAGCLLANLVNPV